MQRKSNEIHRHSNFSSREYRYWRGKQMSCEQHWQATRSCRSTFSMSRNKTILVWFSRAARVVLVVKNRPANAGDSGSVPGSGRSPGEGNGNPLQYSCLENPKDRGHSFPYGKLQSIGSHRVAHEWSGRSMHTRFSRVSDVRSELGKQTWKLESYSL